MDAFFGGGGGYLPLYGYWGGRIFEDIWYHFDNNYIIGPKFIRWNRQPGSYKRDGPTGL